MAEGPRTISVSGHVVGLVLGLLLAGAGVLVWTLDQRGEPATATVLSCATRYKLPPLCRGQWTVGGSVLDGGRFVQGTVDGVNRGDIGKRVAVRASGDTAWTVTLRLPIILWATGAALLIAAAVGRLRRG